MFLPTFLIGLLQVLKGCNKVTLEPYLLQAEQPQHSQLVFIGKNSLWSVPSPGLTWPWLPVGTDQPFASAAPWNLQGWGEVTQKRERTTSSARESQLLLKISGFELGRGGGGGEESEHMLSANILRAHFLSTAELGAAAAATAGIAKSKNAQYNQDLHCRMAGAEGWQHAQRSFSTGMEAELTCCRTSPLLDEHGWAAWQHRQTCCTQPKQSQLWGAAECWAREPTYRHVNSLHL